MSGLPAFVVVLLAMSAAPVKSLLPFSIVSILPQRLNMFRSGRTQCDSTGVFEVQLTALINGLGLTHGGRCCSHSHHNHTRTSSNSNGDYHVSLVGQADKAGRWLHDGRTDSHNAETVGAQEEGEEEEGDEEEDEEEEEECEEECRTFLRVCLSHHQRPPPDSTRASLLACTFGEVLSPVLGGNILDPFGTWGETPATGRADDLDNIVRIPFTFSWPGSYTLRVEAWHDEFGNKSVADPRHVIARIVKGGRLLPSHRWQNVSTFARSAHFSIRFRVKCDKNYYGAGCDVLCRASDNPIIGHYACDGNGSLVCLEGWEGEFCDRAKCSNTCLKGHGFCEQPYDCLCRLGWRGPDCRQCQTYPGCLHGYCKDAWQCICQQGWSGSLCNIDNHYCQRYHPCKNGGTCSYDAVSNYTCACPQGYGGMNCAHAVCYDGFCLNNGLCVMTGGRRSCRCRRGFEGHRCQHAEVTCGRGVCRNNATCTRGEDDFRCLCRPGFKGEWCELEMAECLSSPCKNGGACRDRVNGYHCECRKGFAGRNCDLALDPCTGYRCFNHGTCISTGTGFTPSCLCRPEFTGQRCEAPLDPCVGIYCLHGGTCLRLGSTDFQCACAHEYTGSVCQIPPPSLVCKDQPCLHGGTCRRTHEGATMCACAPGYRGALCESRVPVKAAAAAGTTVTEVDPRMVHGGSTQFRRIEAGPGNLQAASASVCLRVSKTAIALPVTVYTTLWALLRHT